MPASGGGGRPRTRIDPSFIHQCLQVRRSLAEGLAAAAPHLTDARLDQQAQALLQLSLALQMATAGEAAPHLEGLPDDVLGTVHAHMQGLVLRRTAGGEVHFEPCDRARRATGVHYTPVEIVHYMVEHSVEHWLWRGRRPTSAERRDPAVIPLRAWRSIQEVQQLRILDPACGSGAFLLAAYRVLIDHYLARARCRPADFTAAQRDHYFSLGPDQTLRARPALRAAVIRRHLHGIDVDPRALEVIQLSLHLAVHQSDTTPAAGSLVSDLSRNLRHGNTLIPPEALPADRDDGEDQCRIIPLDLQGPGGFPEIMARGGFDVVLGNPPYVFGEFNDPRQSQACAQHLHLAEAGQPDAFKLFYERTVRDLLRPGGIHAFIVPDALLARDEHRDLRRWLAVHLHLQRLCHVGPVFQTMPIDDTGHVKAPRTVGVSAVVTIGQRIAGHAAGAPTVIIDGWADGRAIPGQSLPHDLAVPADGAPWSIHAPSRWFGTDGLQQEMSRTSGTVGTLLTPGPCGITRGEELGKRGLPALNPTAGPEHCAVLVGSDVQRHRVRPPSRMVRTQDVIKNPAFYAGPRILVVKTGAAVVAATSHTDDPVLQSVYSLHLSDDARARIDEDALVGVLCSAWVTAWTWYSWTSGKKQQPQLTLGNVRAIPFPAQADPDTLQMIGAGVGKVRDLMNQLDGEAARADPKMKTTLSGQVEQAERALDEAVGQLYGLQIDEWTDVLAPALRALPSSQRPRWFT